MSRGGQVVQAEGCEHTYEDTHTYIHPHDPTPLHNAVKCHVFSATPTFASWKRVNMSIAYRKQAAHQKHWKVCPIKNLTAFPLDR